MKEKDGITALLTAVLTAQWFGASAAGLLPAAGNAAYLSILLAGAGLTALCTALPRLLPREGLLEICKAQRGMKGFLWIAALLFTLLSAAALRDGLSQLKLTLLPETPRWFALALMLPAVFAMGKGGTAGILRTVRLLAPLLVGLYGAVLVLSGWKQFDVYGLFPLLGKGLSGIGKAAGSAMTTGVWLAPVLLTHCPAKKSRCARRACIGSTILATAGYLCCAMLPDGSSEAAAYPLHRITLSGGVSFAFERMQALFVFVWLPIQTAAVSAGLALAAECIHTALPDKSNASVLCPLIAAAAMLALPDPERSPAWLTLLMQTNTQCLVLLPLLIPLSVGKRKEQRTAKEENSHA